MRGLERLYRALLYLYPASFRNEYGRALTATFVARLRDISGPARTLRGVLAAVGDVAPNAIAAHWEILRQDMRYAGRSLRTSVGFTLTAILVIALGVGANAAAFSLADFVLLRPLPFHDPGRLVDLWESTPGYTQMEFSPANYRDMKAMTHSFAAMGAYSDRTMNLAGTGEPRHLTVGIMTPHAMPVLGVPPLLGRAITPDDSTNEQVVVLSYGLWQTQFGEDARIVGKAIRLDGAPYTVIGVMPASFAFPTREIDAWVPLLMREAFFADRSDNFLSVVARLRPGVTAKQAAADVAAVAARLEQLDPRANERTTAIVLDMRDEMSARSRMLVLALCGAALCILLLACANLASLLLARSAHRSRELAVRAALGAGRERIVRQLVTESMALALFGGIVGVAIAIAGVPVLARLVPDSLPVNGQPSVDLRVLLVAGALVVLTGLTFGVGPAIVAGRSKALDALRSGARGSARTQRLRSVLVTIEVAACVVLLVSSGLLIRAVLRIQGTDPGFRPEGVLTLRTELTGEKAALGAERVRFYDRVLQDVRALPGVERAAYMSGLPMVMGGGVWPTTLAGAPVVRDASNTVGLRFVTPQYFAAMGIPLRAGRDIADGDRRESPSVAVVSESFAKRMWPNENVIGKQFTIASTPRTIVGVVGNVRVRGLERPSEPQVYVPATQLPDGMMVFYAPKDLVIRSTVPAGTILPAVRRIIASADPDQPISDVQMLTDLVARQTSSRVTQLRLLGILATIALVIAGVGIHGLLAFAVSQRSREIGVRRALGEQARSIVGRVMREGLVLATAGVAIGVLVAYLAARAMGALLAGVQPGDPLTLAGAAVLCFVTAVVGCLRPALRAASVDPITVLRGD
ncbi:MAG TPA: ABC transporter permease [Gemmatimonadaceae bacterium]|nr:ABC transporter permease [Gemmatimonadaceae bacterium]